MKHADADAEEGWERGFEDLLTWINKKNAGLTETQCAQLRDYCAHLYDSSGKINLIAQGDRKGLATKHILPSLALSEMLAAVPNSLVLDLGSGAGLPGIPLKISLPESFFYLVESRRKRANFLRDVARRLELKKVEVCNNRIETLRADLTQAVDVVVSRATANMNTLLDWAKPLLKPHGVLIVTLDRSRVMKGAVGVILRRKTAWPEGETWYGVVR